MLKLLIKLPFTLYKRLKEIRDTYKYESISETIEQCIGSTYIDMVLKGDKSKKVEHFFLPKEFVGYPRKGEYGLVDTLAKSQYRTTNNYIQETINKAIIHHEKVKDLCEVCPRDYYWKADKKDFTVYIDTNVYNDFKKICNELRSEKGKVLTELLYYRLKVKGLI